MSSFNLSRTFCRNILKRDFPILKGHVHNIFYTYGRKYRRRFHYVFKFVFCAIRDRGLDIPELVYSSCICYLHSGLIFRPCFVNLLQNPQTNQTTTRGEGPLYNICSSYDRRAFWEYGPGLTRSDRNKTRRERSIPSLKSI